MSRPLCLFGLLILSLFVTVPETRAEDKLPQEPFTRIFSPKEFEKEREAFIIKEAGITPLEAAQFFPIFQESQKRQREINKEIRDCIRQIDAKDVSETKAAELLKKLEALNLQRVELENKFYEEAKQAIGAYKTVKAIAAERKFDRKIFHKMAKPKQ